MFGLSTAEQDGRFSDKNAKLRSTLSFAPNISKPINFKLVNVDILTPWVTRRITELLGVEDEIVAETVMCTLRDAKSNNSTLDAKALQITLTVFLNQGNAKTFMKELISLLLSAMESPGGVPRQLLDEKKEQMLQLVREKSQHAILKLSSMQQHPSPQHASAGIHHFASNLVASSATSVATPGHNVDASTIEALREKLNQKKIVIEKSLTQKAALKAAAATSIRERESSLKTTPPATPLATTSTPSLSPSPALSEDTKVPIQLLRRQFEAKVGIETRISLIKQKIAELDTSQSSTSVSISEDVAATLTRLREAHIQLQEKLEIQSAEILLTIGGKEEVQKAYDEMVALTRSGKSVATALVSMAVAEKASSSKDVLEDKSQTEERHSVRDRERGNDRQERSRDEYHSRRRDHSRNRSKSRERERERESYRDYDRSRSSRDYRGRDRDRGRDHDRNYDRDRERGRDRERSYREYRDRDREREKKRNYSRSRSPSRQKGNHKSRRSPSPDRREK